MAIHRAGSPRRVVRSFRVHVGALAAGGELSGVARPSERETILAGSGVVEDDSNGAAATWERPGVTRVTRWGSVVGDLSGGGGGRSRTPAGRAGGARRDGPEGARTAAT